MRIIQKKVNQLNSSELKQLEGLIYRYYHSASPKFISDRLHKDYGFDIIMLKKGDDILGVNFYHLTKHRKDNWSRTNYILHFGQVMKRSGYKGNIIWTLGTWYARKNIGRAYLFQNVIGLASFISPKAFEHYIRLFPKHHFQLQTDQDKSVRDFIIDYFNNTRGMTIDYNHGFCFDTTDLDIEDITEDWNKVYRAKNDSINDLFIENGIIKMQNNRIYKMPRHITVCGVRRPFPLRKQLNLPQPIALQKVPIACVD